jgi:hypothetical protein
VDAPRPARERTIDVSFHNSYKSINEERTGSNPFTRWDEEFRRLGADFAVSPQTIAMRVR